MINKKFDILVISIFAGIGLFIKSFLPADKSKDGTTGPASAAIWGYGLALLAVFISMFQTFAFTSQMKNISQNSLQFVLNLFTNSLPALLTVIILLWLIYLNSVYYIKINKGYIANEYNSYSYISTFLIATQIFVLFKYLNDMKGGKSALISYVLTLSNVLIISIMTIILMYFSTDG